MGTHKEERLLLRQEYSGGFSGGKQYLSLVLKIYPGKEDVKGVISQCTIESRVYRW